MAKFESPPAVVLRPEVLKLLNQPEVAQLVRKANRDYLYWTELRRQPLPPGVSPEEVWALVKSHRRLRWQVLPFAPGADFLFRHTLTDPLFEQLHHFDLNLGGTLGGPGLIPPEDRSRYMISSIMEEAIASSQLEGAATTREVAKEMLQHDRKPRNRSERMIANNFQTMQLLLELRHQPLTAELLLKIHATITHQTLDEAEKEGRFRTNDEVRVVDYTSSDVVYQPPPHQALPDLLAAFCQFANEEETHTAFIHPVVRGSILHFLLGYLHPFADGNGRTARAIFYWYLLRKGYWLMEYLSISRMIMRSAAQYAKAYLYTEHDENDLTYFINYQVKVVTQALEELKKYVGRKVAEKQEVMSLKRLSGLNERQLTLVQLLLKSPDRSLTIREVERQLDVVYITARADLMRLEALGLVVRKTEGRQKLLFLRAADFEQKLEAMRR